MRIEVVESTAEKGSRVCLQKAAMMVSSATDSTVNFASLGPVGTSATETRRFHFAPVF
jgi:hypothetical protein